MPGTLPIRPPHTPPDNASPAAAAEPQLAPPGGRPPISTPSHPHKIIGSRSAELAPNPGQLDAARQAFEKDLHKHQEAFAARLASLEWDLLIEAPSSKPHAGQFASVARSSRPAASNILIQKSGNKSATRGATSSELAEVFTVNATGPLNSFKQVLIVDDVLASGATVAAIIAALRQRGLSAEAKVTLAVALRVFPTPKTPRPNYLKLISEA